MLFKWHFLIHFETIFFLMSILICLQTNLVCYDRLKTTHVQMIYFAGVLVGSIGLGLLSDTWVIITNDTGVFVFAWSLGLLHLFDTNSRYVNLISSLTNLNGLLRLARCHPDSLFLLTYFVRSLWSYLWPY